MKLLKFLQLGGFRGKFDSPTAGYPGAPPLVIDFVGVNMKLLIVQAVGKHHTIGQDLVQ